MSAKTFQEYQRRKQSPKGNKPLKTKANDNGKGGVERDMPYIGTAVVSFPTEEMLNHFLGLWVLKKKGGEKEVRKITKESKHES